MPDITDIGYVSGQQGFDAGGALPAGDFLGRLFNDFSGKTASNMFAADEAQKARVWSSAEAEKNRDWQTLMSNTAYQRQVDDMKKAGLNPAAVSGNGASTPSGAIPTANAAAAASGGNGGILGLIASLGRAAIAGAVAKKLQINASSAKDSSAAVNAISHETSNAMDEARKAEMRYQIQRRAINEAKIEQKGKKALQEGLNLEDLINKF